jgi:uncharacterized membrane protein HdeD (DUF308 family)
VKLKLLSKEDTVMDQAEHQPNRTGESPPRELPRVADIFRTGELAERMGGAWWLLLVSGVAWIVVTAIILRFDYRSVVAVSVLFGVLAITIGAVEIAIAALSRGWGLFWRGLLGSLFVASGVVAFFTPGDTFVGLAAVISFYFVFAGVLDLSSALATAHVPGWWVQLLAGLIELGLGFEAAGHWAVSATLLVAFVAAMTLIRGVTQITFAFSLRRVHEAAPRT